MRLARTRRRRSSSTTSPSSATTSPRAAPSAAQRVAVGLARRDLAAELVASAAASGAGRRRRAASRRSRAWRRRRRMLRYAAELRDRLRPGSSSGLPCQPSLFSTAFDALALDRARDDHRRPARRARAPRRRRASIASTSWPSISIACQPNASARPRVGVEVPAVHRLAALAEPVDVEDRDRGCRARRSAACSNASQIEPSAISLSPQQHPDAVRAAGRAACRRAPSPTPIGRPWPSEPVATSTHGMRRRRVALEPAAELAEGQQLLVGDRARGLEHRVEQRRGVALGEDQVVVARVVGLRRSRSAGTSRAAPPSGRRRTSTRSDGPDFGDGRAAHRVDAQLLAELAPELVRSAPCGRILRSRRRGNVRYRMRVAVAFDHRGVKLRERVLERARGPAPRGRRPRHRHRRRAHRLPGQGARAGRGDPSRRRRARRARLRLGRRRVGRRLQARRDPRRDLPRRRTPPTRASSTTT